MQMVSKNAKMWVSIPGKAQQFKVKSIAEAKKLVIEHCPVANFSHVWREMTWDHRRRPGKVEICRWILKTSDRKVVVFQEKPLQLWIWRAIRGERPYTR